MIGGVLHRLLSNTNLIKNSCRKYLTAKTACDEPTTKESSGAVKPLASLPLRELRTRTADFSGNCTSALVNSDQCRLDGLMWAPLVQNCSAIDYPRPIVATVITVRLAHQGSFC
uniref:Uncharacterized protein n=1 Tax=Arundo donax TaxID=35708 RepID=A0A0A9D0S2_ARUDO